MPPAVPDNEDSDSGPDEIPARDPPVEPEKSKDDDDENENEDDDDEDAEDEYRVEKIISHKTDADGVVKYLIKWEGYERKSDQTWEPIENLDNSGELLRDYHVSVGGTPQPEAKPEKKKGGKRTSTKAFGGNETGTQKRQRKSETNGAGEPPPLRNLPDGSWENHILRVSSILDDTTLPLKGEKGEGERKLVTFIEWNDGKKTQHHMSVIRRKAPQKLLDYYEQHLVFKKEVEPEEG